MAERFYTTRALVIAERPAGESSIVYTLFTRELGLLHAHAKSVREVKSKLRYNLSLYAQTLVTLVPGREYWKLIGAEDSRVGTNASLARFLCRFMPELEDNAEIFDSVSAHGLSSDTAAERRLMLATLDKLGYVGREAENPREVEALLERAVYSSHL